MIVSWDFYIKRKKIILEEWLHKKKVTSYDNLVDVTQKLGIEAPPEENVSKYFKKPEVKEKNVQKTKRRVKKTSKLGKTGTHVSDNNFTINESETDKKPRKRRTYRKRKPAKKEDK